MKTELDYSILGNRGWASWCMYAQAYHRFFGLLENTVKLSELKVLDIGCGSGTWTRWYVELGCDPNKIYGIDILPELIVESELKNKSIHYKVSDIFNYADNSFDMITLNVALMCISEKQRLVDKLYTMLNDTGILVICDKQEEFKQELFKKWNIVSVELCQIGQLPIEHKFVVFRKAL